MALSLPMLLPSASLSASASTDPLPRRRDRLFLRSLPSVPSDMSAGRWLETGREIVLKFKTSKPFLLLPSSAGGSLRLAVAAFSSSKQCQNAPTRLATADSGGRKVIRVNKSGGYRVPRIQSRSTSWQRMYKSNGYEVILLCCALRIDRASRVYSHVARDVVDWRSGGDGN